MTNGTQIMIKMGHVQTGFRPCIFMTFIEIPVVIIFESSR